MMLIKRHGLMIMLILACGYLPIKSESISPERSLDTLPRAYTAEEDEWALDSLNCAESLNQCAAELFDNEVDASTQCASLCTPYSWNGDWVNKDSVGCCGCSDFNTL